MNTARITRSECVFAGSFHAAQRLHSGRAMLHNPSYRQFGYTFFIALALSAGCSSSADHSDAARSKKFSHDTQSIANIAQRQVGCGGCGGGACSVYATSGGNSCNNPGEWCSDFVMWAWSQAGFSIDALTPCSASYIQYGNNNGTMHTTPQVGDAIIWNYPNGQACAADHVELVYAVNADGSVDGISGNGGGGNGVVTHDPPCGALGECDGYTRGWSISAFVGPAGGGGAPSGGGGPPPPPPGGGSGGGGDPCSGINDCTYCGNDNQGPGGDPSTLYQCSGGVLVSSTPCPNGCQITPGNSCDVCNPGSSPPPSGGGADPCSGINDCTYCGNDNQGPGGDPNTLYQCSGGVLVGSTPCANGCQITPGNSCDACN